MDPTATTEAPSEPPAPLPLAFTLPIVVMVGSVFLWVFLRWTQRGAQAALVDAAGDDDTDEKKES